jgi:hypothetical protein
MKQGCFIEPLFEKNAPVRTRPFPKKSGMSAHLRLLFELKSQ